MSLHQRVYRRLLSVYPPAFRARYESPMVGLFTDQLRDSGPMRAWTRAVPDLFMTATTEHLRRNRSVATSLTSVPTLSARALGIAGVLGGLVLLAPFFITLDQAWFPPRLILFAAFVIAVSIGLYRRQAAVSPRLAMVATSVVIGANAGYLAMVALGMADLNPFGTAVTTAWVVAGVAIWAAAALYGVAALAIGAFSRLGPILLVIGSVAIVGIDRLGLVDGSLGSVFGPLALLGVFLHGAGWTVLGVELALRGATVRRVSAS